MFGAVALGVDAPATLEHWLAGANALGPWTLPAAVLAFALLAMLGVPQIALVAAAVVAFGPDAGFAYSWIGNLVASTIGWAVGRALGEDVVRAHAGATVARLMRKVADHGFMTCLLIRLAPTVPFMIVNMAAGVAGVRARDFVLGTALGSIPKIALVVFAGHSLMRALGGGGFEHYLAIGLSAAVWIGMGLLARRWMREDDEADLAAARPS
ncbi:MAG: VTT domain-containing protein [Caulobacteraceae bacterium]|nr:VTT domain-containing protein [Caulobacteraceae bacterium]